MPGFKVKVGASYVSPSQLKVRWGGSSVTPQAVYVKSGGVNVKVWPLLPEGDIWGDSRPLVPIDTIVTYGVVSTVQLSYISTACSGPFTYQWYLSSPVGGIYISGPTNQQDILIASSVPALGNTTQANVHLKVTDAADPTLFTEYVILLNIEHR